MQCIRLPCTYGYMASHVLHGIPMYYMATEKCCCESKGLSARDCGQWVLHLQQLEYAVGIASWSSAEESALHVGAGIDCNAMIKLHKQRWKKSCDTNWRRMYDVHLHVTPEVSHVMHGNPCNASCNAWEPMHYTGAWSVLKPMWCMNNSCNTCPTHVLHELSTHVIHD